MKASKAGVLTLSERIEFVETKIAAWRHVLNNFEYLLSSIQEERRILDEREKRLREQHRAAPGELVAAEAEMARLEILRRERDLRGGGSVGPRSKLQRLVATRQRLLARLDEIEKELEG